MKESQLHNLIININYNIIININMIYNFPNNKKHSSQYQMKRKLFIFYCKN